MEGAGQTSPLPQLYALLEKLVEKHPQRDIVAVTAQWIAAHAIEPWTLHILIKLRTWVSGDRARTFNNKLMLFYVIHEFLKCPATPAQRKDRQQAWLGTVEHTLLTCLRDLDDSKKADDHKKKLFKILGRWEELGIYRGRLREWRRIVNGETRLRKASAKILVPGVMDPYDKDGMNMQMSVHRLNLPCLMEVPHTGVVEKKRQWRFTGVAFIDALGHALGLSEPIVVTAMHYFHTLFDRGFFALERYKIAAACLFLAAKASSQRMRLLRMVHVMHYILETPLQYGDEEKEELERLHLLHYEQEVMQGLAQAMSVELPLAPLQELLARLPPSCSDVDAVARGVLRELFWTTMCIDYPPAQLAQASVHIACHMTHKRFDAAWLGSARPLVPLQSATMLQQYMQLHEWKVTQRRLFEAATRTDELKHRFLAAQKGGLTFPVNAPLDAPTDATNQIDAPPPPPPRPKETVNETVKEIARGRRSPSRERRRSPSRERRRSPSRERKRSYSTERKRSYSTERKPHRKEYHSSRYSRSRSADRSRHRRRSPSYDRRGRRHRHYDSASDSSDDDRYRRRGKKYASSRR
ncbi:hypothetical protein ACHHYP_00281 [Achlya hypogyna]|uniref:CID domain-containing protein n=1 Tax=Achlya hypogyna TaxID=1202772 RepID=A0A1V9ZUR8_ACHHY|nr:hypothetical protein ACHHYP_00281 [Achlya hypogyna]